MVPILKENGEIRICIDMRRANMAIIRENHPLPTMDQILPQFRNAKYFSKLDLRNAFHQIEITPNQDTLLLLSRVKDYTDINA